MEKNINGESTVQSAEVDFEAPSASIQTDSFEDSACPCSQKPREKKRSGSFVLCICLLMALCLMIGSLVTLVVVGKYVGGLENLKLVRSMGKYDVSIFSELLSMIDQYHYGDELDGDALVEAGAHAIVAAVGDTYASYFTVDEYNSYSSSMNGNYSGIGISVYAPTETGALVHRVFKGSFAETAGVHANDLITYVDGTSVIGLSSAALTELIGGEAGTTVVLTIVRGDETLDITVERGNVYIERVEYKLLDNGIGYIYISSFTGNADTELEAALAALTAEGATSLIIDLRDNPGGSLYTVVDMADMLLPECVIASWQGKTVNPAEYFNSDADCCALPMVVLVNGNSASASEIFAGAMQDNGRAIIIGTQTFGKGIVQTTFPLTGGHGWLKLTTDAYFTPNGTNLNGTGITPDMVVELPEELQGYDIYSLYTELFSQDTQLQAAIAYLSGD